MTKTNLEGAEAYRRQIEFEVELGSRGFFENGIIRSVHQMARLLGVFFGQANADAGLSKILAGCFTNRGEHENWQEILDDEFIGIFSETPVGQLLHDLTAYADYGILLQVYGDANQRRQHLERQIAISISLMDLLPVERWDLDGEHLIRLLRRAQARWKVDSGTSVDARELGVLSNRAFQTIKNKLSAGEIVGNQARIDAAEAIAWLSSQRDFELSIWQQQHDINAPAQRVAGVGKVLFLPVASDGSMFHPGLAQSGVYRVDGPGNVREFGTYEEALAALQSMVVPQWRRPTKENVWTRVRAVEWRRVPVDELDDLALI